MVYAPLGIKRNIRCWVLWAAISLGVMVVFETGIAISFAMERMNQVVTLVWYGSAFLLISTLTAIVVFSNHKKDGVSARDEAHKPQGVDVSLEQKARDLLEETQLFLDTDLTLERLVRRLHVPACALSEAVNQIQGLNVSQYVNGFRLTHAADMLVQTDQSVTRVLERSGFLTRSNFYCEFERLYQQSPVEYRKRAAKSKL